jgi:NAD(P)-dependent dehydrogenase (short-subunit alcohol dehydrogenase family)
MSREELAMSGEFAGMIAVVTGGASGIGAACCRRFSVAGAKVIVADIAPDQARAVADEIGGVPIALDVGVEASIEAACAEIERLHGAVDILVNSAGVIQQPGPPEALSVDTLDRVIAIDQRGLFLSCVCFGSRMAKRGHGAIVNIASIAGMRSTPLHAYGPVKAAVIAITECLATEWGRSGVRVNAVSPGFTMTPVIRRAIELGLRDPAMLSGNTALNRMVEPEEVASAVVFLSSSEASAITGVNLPVDCGWLVTPSWHTYGGIRSSQAPVDASSR